MSASRIVLTTGEAALALGISEPEVVALGESGGLAMLLTTTGVRLFEEASVRDKIRGGGRDAAHEVIEQFQPWDPKPMAYSAFFAQALEELKATSPGATQATRVPARNWFAIAAGIAGVGFRWHFRREGLRVVLDIDVPQPDGRSREVYRRLRQARSEIEEAISTDLLWESPSSKRRGRRIEAAYDRPVDILSPTEELDRALAWAVVTMAEFVAAFRWRLREMSF